MSKQRLTDAELDALVANHRPVELEYNLVKGPFCHVCSLMPWPCPTTQLITELRTLREQHAALVTALEEIATRRQDDKIGRASCRERV